MMVALLLYAYCVGERSSRRIERRCKEDVAFRVIAANQVPDHTTIARFRQGHEEALASCFTEVLKLCAAAGLLRVGLDLPLAGLSTDRDLLYFGHGGFSFLSTRVYHGSESRHLNFNGSRDNLADLALSGHAKVSHSGGWS